MFVALYIVFAMMHWDMRTYPVAMRACAGTFDLKHAATPHSRYSYNPSDSLSFSRHLRRGYGLSAYARPKFSFAHSHQLGTAVVQ